MQRTCGPRPPPRRHAPVPARTDQPPRRLRLVLRLDADAHLGGNAAPDARLDRAGNHHSRSGLLETPSGKASPTTHRDPPTRLTLADTAESAALAPDLDRHRSSDPPGLARRLRHVLPAHRATTSGRSISTPRSTACGRTPNSDACCWCSRSAAVDQRRHQRRSVPAAAPRDVRQRALRLRPEHERCRRCADSAAAGHVRHRVGAQPRRVAPSLQLEYRRQTVGWGLNASINGRVHSGTPYNVTTGRDENRRCACQRSPRRCHAQQPARCVHRGKPICACRGRSSGVRSMRGDRSTPSGPGRWGWGSAAHAAAPAAGRAVKDSSRNGAPRCTCRSRTCSTA